jgi:hypothetical protein
MTDTKVSKSVVEFTPELVCLGVAWFVSDEEHTSSQTTLFNKLDATNIDLANMSSYRGEFGRMALAYFVSVYGDEYATFLADPAVAGKATFSLDRIGSKAKPVESTKKLMQGQIRAKVRRLTTAYEKHLKGGDKSRRTRETLSTYHADVKALAPRLAAYQKLEGPSTQQNDQRKLLQALIDTSISQCAKAKKWFVAEVKRQASATAKSAK